MNIPLNVLINALTTIKTLRDVADDKMTTAQFMQAMRSCSDLNYYVEAIAKQINVEVEA